MPPHHRSNLTWTSLVGFGLRVRVARRAKLLQNKAHWQRESARLQRGILASLLGRAQRTAFGRAHDFGRIAKLTDPGEQLAAYQAAVPIRGWFDIKDDVERMRHAGEPDILWPGLVKRFANTSGTTAGDKQCPVTDEMMRANFRASLDIFAHLHNRGVSIPRLMGGKCLFLGGSSDLDINEHGIATGDLSGLVTPMIRWPLSAIYSPGAKISLMDDWHEKIEAMSQLAAMQDIRFISGMPSWALVLMKRVLEITGRHTIREVWPNLTVFVHGGVRYDPFNDRIARTFGGDATTDIPVRHELYPASEAFVAMQDTPGDPGLRLLVDNDVFFEFVPVEQVHAGVKHPDAFTCEGAEPGQRYSVIVTTCAGLWRWNMGDVVVFDEVPDRLDGSPGTGPARLRIVGRDKHYLNAFGENILVEFVERGVSAAARASGLTTGEFTTGPVYPDSAHKAGTELVVEIEGTHDAERLELFRRAFDASMIEDNVDYRAKRSGGAGMGEPRISVVPMGSFHRWLDASGKLGGQHKCPRCSNDRKMIEAVLAAADTGPS